MRQLVTLLTVAIALAAVFTGAQAASQNYYRYVSVASATCVSHKAGDHLQGFPPDVRHLR